jgi:hypothetical protein
MGERHTAAGHDSAGSGRVIATHPNASVALRSALGLGALIPWDYAAW